MALRLRFEERAERDDLQALGARLLDDMRRQRRADAEAAQAVGRAGVVDDDPRLAGARTG